MSARMRRGVVLVGAAVVLMVVAAGAGHARAQARTDARDARPDARTDARTDAPAEPHPAEPHPDARLPGPPAPGEHPAGRPQGEGGLWAGHQVVQGVHRIPILGDLTVQVDTFVLARRERQSDGRVVLRQHACRTAFAEVAGVTTRVPEDTIRELPPDVIRFFEKGDWWYAAPWVSGWGEQDVDGDGHPGVTIEVDAPLCGGRLYVSTESANKARARIRDGKISGEIRVVAGQDVLGASNPCLSVVSSDTRQRLEGRFEYVPVDDDATCDALLKQGWPVRVELESLARGD